MAYIYKITNKITGKMYVGKTYYTDINKRFQEHCKDSKKRKFEKRPLYNAMNKYGIENFYIEEIEETDKPEERENYWIDKLDTYHNGYNATRGGDGKPYLDYQEILRLFKEGNTCIAISKKLNCHEDSVRNALKSMGITSEELKQNALQSNRKMVIQIDAKTNNVIAIHDSIMAAGRAINKSTRHIGEVCRGERKTAYGYIWKFLKEK